MKPSLAAAACLLAACGAGGPRIVEPTSVPARILDFGWRNNTPTQSCYSLLTGDDAAFIWCSADQALPVRITVSDLHGDCSPSGLPRGTRCKTIDGIRGASGYWEAPSGGGINSTAETAVVTCQVFDARGQVADSKTTCIASYGIAAGPSGIQYFLPPWPDSCQALLQGCHAAPPR